MRPKLTFQPPSDEQIKDTAPYLNRQLVTCHYKTQLIIKVEAWMMLSEHRKSLAGSSPAQFIFVFNRKVTCHLPTYIRF